MSDFVLINYHLRKKITVSWDINSPNCISKFGGYRTMLNNGWVDRRELKPKSFQLTKVERFKMYKKFIQLYTIKLNWMNTKQSQIINEYGQLVFNFWYEDTIERLDEYQSKCTNLKVR